MLFLGAIQSIPPYLYDAATLDGANRWQIFRSIVLPGINGFEALRRIRVAPGASPVPARRCSRYWRMSSRKRSPKAMCVNPSETARRTLDPGVTWFGWQVPPALEVVGD